MLLEVIADGALAAAANIAAGAVVLPDLASARLRASLADALQALGHSVSGYAGLLTAERVKVASQVSSNGVRQLKWSLTQGGRARG